MSSPTEPATPGRQELLDELLRASRESSAVAVFFHSAIAEQAGLGVTDHKTLDILSRAGPLTAGEIAAHTGLTTAAVTSLIDRLEQKGFVRRVRDSKDRRRVRVELDEARLADAYRFFDSMQGKFAELTRAYSDEQLATIIDFLTRAAHVSRQFIAQMRREATTETGADDAESR